mmetsp:Transcript_59359/g.98022  ORF Transcript_59359/g.98022 Transcript_59359/m.98022 type:complete len:165 (+) Transcript_59359:46-540(+)
MGCLSTRFCGIILAILNTAMMVGYFIGVIILETSCDQDCYPGLVLLIMVLAGPVALYITGYFLAWLAYSKGSGASDGCNFFCVILFSILLMALLAVMCAHAYEMITQHAYEYSDIYGGMVLGNVAYSALLGILLCNIMPKNDKDRNRRHDFDHLDDSEPSRSDV